jgi:hypothetical protein
MAGRPVRIAVLCDTKDFETAMDRAARSSGDFEKATDKATTSAREMEDRMGGVGEGADTVASKGSQAAGALSGLGDVVGGKVGGAMMGLGGAFQIAADSGDLLNAAVEGGGKLLGKAAAATRALTKAETYKNLATKAAAGYQWALNAAMTANPIGLIVAAIAVLVTGLVLFFTKTDIGRKIFTTAFGAIKKALAAVASFVTDTLWPTFMKVFRWTPLGLVVTNFTKVVSFVKTLPGKVTRAAAGLFNAVSEKAAAVVGSYAQGGGGVRGRMWSIVNFVTTLPGKIGSAAGGLFASFTEKAAAVVGSYAQGGGGIKGKLWSIVNFITSLPSKIKTAASGMWDGIGDAFKAAVNWVIAKWNGIEFSLPSFKAFGKTIGGFTVGTPDIPYLASGGVTTGPMLAMIGDNPGGREAVIPLDKSGLFGNTYNITVNVPLGASPAEAGRQIVKAIEAFERSGGRRRAA